MARVGYPTDLTDEQWALIAPHLPLPRPGGKPRRTDLRAVVDGILYLLRTGCQWRLLPRDFPPWGTVWSYFRQWRIDGVWGRLHRALYRAARKKSGRRPDPTVVIMDSQSVKTTEKGAVLQGSNSGRTAPFPPRFKSHVHSPHDRGRSCGSGRLWRSGFRWFGSPFCGSVVRVR